MCSVTLRNKENLLILLKPQSIYMSWVSSSF